jgi:PAS domain S-box-containing protein
VKPKREQPRAASPKAITPQIFFVPLLYYIFSVIWISTTDEIVATMSTTPRDMMLLSMYKGWFFVFLTSILIAGMLIIAARQQYFSDIKQKETDARMRALIENSPDIIARYGKDLKYLYVSPSIVALTGIKAQDCIGKTNRELGLIPTFQQNLESLILSVFETSSPVHIVYETKSPLGQISLDVRLIPEHGVEGSVVSVLSTARDITEIVHAEKALRASEERYRELVEQSQDATAIFQDNQYVYANPASAHLLGYSSPSDIVGKSLEELIAPEDLERIKEYKNRRLDGLEAPASYEARMLRRDGSKTWVEVSASVREYKGKPAVQVAYYSIDARKKAEETLKTREAMLHGIFAAAPIGIGMVRNRILGWTNTALQEMLGYSSDELNGKNARVLYESDKEYQRVAEVKHPLIDRDGIGRMETQFIAKNGRKLDILLSSAPIIAKGE